MDVFAKAREAHPLPAEEDARLTQVLVGSLLITTVMGIFCCVILSCLEGTRLPVAIIDGWAADLARALAVGWPFSLGLGIGAGAVMFALSAATETLTKRSPEGRKAIAELRGGLSGEIPRLPLWKVAPIMLGVGLVEETCFRYAVIGGIMFVAEPVLGFPVAAVIAVAISTALFTALHTQYHDLYAFGQVAVFGILLGSAYVLTGALTVVAVAHGLYDLADVAREARKMTKDPAYFKGAAPTNAVEEEFDRMLRGE